MQHSKSENIQAALDRLEELKKQIPPEKRKFEAKKTIPVFVPRRDFGDITDKEVHDRTST